MSLVAAVYSVICAQCPTFV